MNMLRPDQSEAAHFARRMEVVPQYNYLCVTTCPHILEQIGIEFMSSKLLGDSMMKMDYFFVITPDRLILREVKNGSAEVWLYSKEQVYDFKVRRAFGLPFEYILSFAYFGTRYRYSISTPKVGRMSYNHVNVEHLNDNRWLGFQK